MNGPCLDVAYSLADCYYFFVDWQKHIHSDPNILLGKPVVRGTRLSVDFILRLFAQGWTEKQVLENYPSLTPDALKAVFSFTADLQRF